MWRLGWTRKCLVADPNIEELPTATEIAADLLEAMVSEAQAVSYPQPGVTDLRISIDNDGWVEVVSVAVAPFYDVGRCCIDRNVGWVVHQFSLLSVSTTCTQRCGHDMGK